MHSLKTLSSGSSNDSHYKEKNEALIAELLEAKIDVQKLKASLQEFLEPTIVPAQEKAESANEDMDADLKSEPLSENQEQIQEVKEAIANAHHANEKPKLKEKQKIIMAELEKINVTNMVTDEERLQHDIEASEGLLSQIHKDLKKTKEENPGVDELSDTASNATNEAIHAEEESKTGLKRGFRSIFFALGATIASAFTMGGAALVAGGCSLMMLVSDKNYDNKFQAKKKQSTELLGSFNEKINSKNIQWASSLEKVGIDVTAKAPTGKDSINLQGYLQKKVASNPDKAIKIMEHLDNLSELSVKKDNIRSIKDALKGIEPNSLNQAHYCQDASETVNKLLTKEALMSDENKEALASLKTLLDASAGNPLELINDFPKIERAIYELEDNIDNEVKQINTELGEEKQELNDTLSKHEHAIGDLIGKETTGAKLLKTIVKQSPDVTDRYSLARDDFDDKNDEVEDEDDESEGESTRLSH